MGGCDINSTRFAGLRVAAVAEFVDAAIGESPLFNWRLAGTLLLWQTHPWHTTSQAIKSTTKTRCVGYRKPRHIAESADNGTSNATMTSTKVALEMVLKQISRTRSGCSSAATISSARTRGLGYLTIGQ